MTALPSPHADTVTRCQHCGAAMERTEARFCCPGCEVASAIVSGAGLERYYAEREAPAPRPEPLRDGWDLVPVQAEGDDRCSAQLRIDGMTCASCAWVTEHVLEATPGVLEVRVNMTNGRAFLAWDPARTSLPVLAGRIAAIGYRPRPAGAVGTPDRELLLKAGFAVFAAMNVMGLSAAIYAGWFDGMDPKFQALFRWVSLVLATPVVTWCAAPFFQATWAGLRHRLLHVDLPVSIGILAMYTHGVWATLHAEDGWLDSLTMLVSLLLIGRVLEQRGRRAASEAAAALAGTAPATARREREGGAVETVPAKELQVGDLVLVGAGEEVPADGEVVRASGPDERGARVRMAVLTGESEPVSRAPGDAVVAGALVEDGTLTVAVSAAGPDTLVQRMARSLADALDRPMPRELADRAAPWFTGATLLVAGAAFTGWSLATDTTVGAHVAMAVLVVACPCALALAGPLSAAVGLGAAARRGLLVRGGGVLRQLARVDLVVVDKTGTLTHGVPQVVEAADAVLRVAAGLERASSHPIARAVLAEAARRGMPLPEATEVRELAGVGVTGALDGQHWRLRAGAPGEVVLERFAAGSDEGDVVDLWRQEGVIRLRDVLRADAPAGVRGLRSEGLPKGVAARRVVLLTGDRPEVAERIGGAAGVDEIVAAATPEEKAAWVKARQAEGRVVLFVGDGLNDGPALAASDVGIAMGEGAASTVTVADAVVAGDGIGPVVTGLRLAAAVDVAVRRGAVRSVIYNLSAVAAALAGLVNPLVAAVLMPLSSGMVAWTASRVAKAAR